MFWISLFRYVSVSEVAIRPSKENDEKRNGGQLKCPPSWFKDC
jgi:hypothetical protein